MLLPRSLLFLAPWTALAVPGLCQQLRFDIAGGSPGGEFGSAVAFLGDLDGDSVPDFAAGAPDDSLIGSRRGAVYVFSGGTGQLLYRFDGDADQDRLGVAVAGAGDVDGDGVPDVLAGSFRDNNIALYSGYVRVWSGATGVVLHTFRTASGWDAFGQAVAGPGDLDGDGQADILAGAPEDDWRAPGAGAVLAFSGRTGAILHTLRGDQPWALYGFALTGTGDLDGDGTPDFAVGAPREDTAWADAGVVRVHSGRSGVLLYRHEGAQEQEALGISLAGGRDLDFDGVPDLVAGAVYDFNPPVRRGLVRAWSGADGSLLHLLEFAMIQDGFGRAVALGDLDGDEAADLVVGIPHAGILPSPGIDAGAVEVHSGARGALLLRLDGEAGLDNTGTGVDAGADLDGDGLEDLLVGEPGRGNGGSIRVWLAPSRPRLIPGEPVAGGNHDLEVAGAIPGAQVLFFGSLAGFGSARLPGTPLFGDLAPPVQALGGSTAAADGRALLGVTIPAGLAGRRAWLQAAESSAAAGWRVTAATVADIR